MDACPGHILEGTKGIESAVYKNHNPSLYIT